MGIAVTNGLYQATRTGTIVRLCPISRLVGQRPAYFGGENAMEKLVVNIIVIVSNFH